VNTAITIGMRELRERSRLFVIAGALAILPFLVAAMPNLSGNRRLAIATVSGIGALNYAFALAILLGVSIVGRELSEKRLSFYFARPVEAWAIWAGKAGAALLTLITVAALIAIPGWLAAPSQWQIVWARDNWIIWRASAVACLFFFLGGHVLGTMMRSRSVLIVIDFVLGVLAAAAAFLVIRPLLFSGAFQLAAGVQIAMGTALLAVLAIVPVWQLSRGRADVRRSHSALSRALWPAIGAIILIAGAYSAWMTSTTFASIDEVQHLEQSPSGEWVFVTGGDDARRNIPASFLLHTATGKSERLNISPWTGVEFSRDGRVLAWTEPAELIPRYGGIRVYTRALTPGAKSHDTQITGSLTDRLALSADGSRLAMLDHKQLRIHDLATGRLVAAASGIKGTIMSLFFPSPDVVRMVVHPRSSANAEIFEFDVARKKLEKTGEIDVPTGFTWSSLTASEDGRWFYLNKNAAVLDGRTGAVRTQLPIQPESHRASVMLGDGRIAWTSRGVLRLYDRSGAPIREIRLPIVRGSVVGQAGTSKLVLAGRMTEKHEASIQGRHMLIVDLEKGVVEKVVKDVYGPAMDYSIDPRLQQYTADATYAGMDANRKFTRWK